MENMHSFTYTISSANATSGNAEDCYINLRPLPYNYEYYNVQCTGFIMNCESMDQATMPNYVHLVADDLAENGYYQGFDSNQCIVSYLLTDANISQMTSGEGSIFRVKNMRQQRRIRFRLYAPDLTPLSGVVDDSDTTYWCISLLFSPVIAEPATLELN